MDYRLIYSDDGTLTDYSTDLNGYYSGTAAMTFVASEDKIYVGSLYAFNSLYFKVSTAAASNAGISIKYWDSKVWRSAVEVIDETAGFQSSGYVTWQVDRQYGWNREDTVNASGVANIAALSGVTIYDMHWAEITLASNSVFTLSWIGHIFSNDNDLKTEYPELNNSNLLTAIESGKTDYEEQAVRASQLVVEDLVSQGIIKHSSQLLDRRKLTTVNVCKVAELVYTMLGDDYIDQRRDAKNEYKSRLKRGLWNTDLNNDGNLSLAEARFKQGFGYR